MSECLRDDRFSLVCGQQPFAKIVSVPFFLAVVHAGIFQLGSPSVRGFGDDPDGFSRGHCHVVPIQQRNSGLTLCAVAANGFPVPLWMPEGVIALP